MNLLRYASLSNWTVENIQSYEPENTLMPFAVFCNEHALHETHVRLKRQVMREPRTSSGATDSVQSHEALEIRDLRWFIEACQGSCSRLNWKVVDEDAERRNTSGYRFRVNAFVFVFIFIFSLYLYLYFYLGPHLQSLESRKPNLRHPRRLSRISVEKQFRRFDSTGISSMKLLKVTGNPSAEKAVTGKYQLGIHFSSLRLYSCF